ncbi:MAG: ABC transporter substrate-binding protein [Acidimicrobiia bacterium]|nr:ABC transporter substrate-binding protein [Acidimicrobiia bacterium]
MFSPTVRLVSTVLLGAMVATGCATPDLGPPSSTTLAIETPTPTPTPEADSALGPSNTTTTTTVTVETDPTPTPTPVPDPEPGITEDIIRIGVIADASTGAVGDDRGLSAWNAVAAWAQAVNDEGGLADRRVVVDFIDSAVFNHEDAVREACVANVFALVGSWALNDDQGLDMLLSPDCSLPDFAAEARTPRRRQSPATYGSNPFANNLSLAGPAAYLAEQFPDSVANAAAPVLDIESKIISGERLLETYTDAGWTITQRPVIALDADLTETAAQLAEAEIDALVWDADGGRLIDLLGALDELDALPTVVDCRQVCYDQDWVTAAGPLGEGVGVSLTNVPFEEADTAVELTLYEFWLGRARPDAVPDAVGLAAWSAGRLFEDAVNRATLEGTANYDPDRLTQAAVLDAAETITDWDANGLHGVSNPADDVPSPCFVALALVEGAWIRVHPFGRGEFDCEDGNVIELEATLELGLDNPQDEAIVPDN